MNPTLRLKKLQILTVLGVYQKVCIFLFQIFALNRYDSSKAKFEKELKLAVKKHLYRYVETDTSESSEYFKGNFISALYYMTPFLGPEPPYNVRVSWKPAYQLNVCWNHPNSTNGHVKSFKILVKINKNHDTYYDIQINSPKEYQLEYCKSIIVIVSENTFKNQSSLSHKTFRKSIQALSKIVIII